jgi:ABC-type antimicrobial peptide transport system permease subunit
VFRPRDTAILTVGQRTFEGIVRTVFGTGWDEFVREHDSGANSFGVNVPQSVFAYVPDVADIVPVADALEARGFDTAYTLRAFDDLAGTVDTAFIAAAAIGMAILLAGGALIVANVASYFRLARRDIGALKHFGYGTRRIRSMYRRRLARLLAIAAIPGLVLIGATGVVAGLPWTDLVLDLGGVGIVLMAMYLLIDGVPLRAHTAADVLTLLHREREFG